MDVNNEYLCWLQKCLENQNLKSYEASFMGKTDNCDGYVGDIVFVTVNGVTNENKDKVFHLAIKHGKRNLHLRQIVSVKEAFEAEIFIYDKLLPAFRQFQLERKIKEPFESVPRCYKTLILENMEVLIFDDLKKYGYELHDRMKPFNLPHLKFVLKQYGKLHALSFALKDQRNEEFISFAGQSINGMRALLSNESINGGYQRIDKTVLGILQRRNDLALLDKYKNLLQKTSSDMMLDIMDAEESQTVFAHADCWNNNFMFKYGDGNKTSPTKVAILDWQASALLSPVCDLSYFIYSTSSKEGLDKFDELMEYYYASFSTFLISLGSNPEELFPFEALKVHWRKYAGYGLFIVPMVMQFALCNKEDAPEFENIQEDEVLADKMNLDISKNDLYYERVKAVLDHFFNNTF